MKLFSNESIHISKIHTVLLYKTPLDAPEPRVIKYDINLFSYELIFFISADNTTCFGTQVIQDQANSIRYLPKGINSGAYIITEKIPNICIDIYFDTPDPMPSIACSFENMTKLRPLFEKLYHIWNSKKPGYYSKAMSVFYDIIHTFQIRQDGYLGKAQEEKLSAAYDYMLDHYQDTKFDYHAMCSNTGLSYSYFKKLFIRQHGVSPVKYVTHLKINLAKELLITKKYSVTEIAQICGFENIYYFSTVFKKECGISPKNYERPE